MVRAVLTCELGNAEVANSESHEGFVEAHEALLSLQSEFVAMEEEFSLTQQALKDSQAEASQRRNNSAERDAAHRILVTEAGELRRDADLARAALSNAHGDYEALEEEWSRTREKLAEARA